MKLQNKTIFLTFLLLFILFINISFNSAFSSRINLVNSSNGSFSDLTSIPVTISYKFNTGETISKMVSTENDFTINLSNELFCYSDCNIVPTRLIIMTDILKDSQTVSHSEIPQGNLENYNSLINIYLGGEKINQTTNYNQDDFSLKIISNMNNINENNYMVEWNGQIITNESRTYYFSLQNISGGAKVILDGNILLDDLKDATCNSRNFSVNLQSGIHNISFAYWTSQYSKPNLFIKNKNNIYEKVSNNILIFINGNVKKKVSETRVQAMAGFPQSYNIDYSIN